MIDLNGGRGKGRNAGVKIAREWLMNGKEEECFIQLLCVLDRICISMFAMNRIPNIHYDVWYLRSISMYSFTVTH